VFTVSSAAVTPFRAATSSGEMSSPWLWVVFKTSTIFRELAPYIWWRTPWPPIVWTTGIVLNLSTIVLLEGARPRAPLLTPRIQTRVAI